MGSMADLNAASLEYVAGFYRTYYAPNNAVLSLAGDFQTPDAAGPATRQYFQPSRPSRLRLLWIRTEPDQKAERRVTIDDPFARLPRLSDIAYKGVIPRIHRIGRRSTCSETSLFSGQSSRLYRKLVKDQVVALQVGGGHQLSAWSRISAVVAVLEARRRPSLKSKK